MMESVDRDTNRKGEEGRTEGFGLGRIPKEGERILAPTRRPDGTLRKPIRIRAGYIPQDEVAIYQSKGTLLKKCAQPEFPPGYDPQLDAKPKTKSVKRNERKKEKKIQAALASADSKGKILYSMEAEEAEPERVSSTNHTVATPKSIKEVSSLTSKMNMISVSSAHISSTADPSECPNPVSPDHDLDKKIRALKKKIRLAEGLQKGTQQNMKPEQLEKLAKLEGWQEELRCLEDRKATLAA